MFESVHNLSDTLYSSDLLVLGNYLFSLIVKMRSFFIKAFCCVLDKLICKRKIRFVVSFKISLIGACNLIKFAIRLSKRENISPTSLDSSMSLLLI